MGCCGSRSIVDGVLIIGDVNGDTPVKVKVLTASLGVPFGTVVEASGTLRDQYLTSGWLEVV